MSHQEQVRVCQISKSISHQEQVMGHHISKSISHQEEVKVHHISKSNVVPSITLQETRCHLTPWDMRMLSFGYMQEGLLLSKPQNHHHLPQQQKEQQEPLFIERLRVSLSLALVHFYPLAGRLVTEQNQDGTVTIFISCNSAGADFIYAATDISIADILNPTHIPPFVESLFVLNEEMNHEGHTVPLLAVQVTELLDAIFIGFSLNHAVADGISLWHFINTWSEICRGSVGIEFISQPPIIERHSLEDPPLRFHLPEHDFSKRFIPPPLKERIFHIKLESIARIKAKANEQCNTNRITSFQALSAHVWRSVTKARGLASDECTVCYVAINDRPKLQPPLSPNHLGNYVSICPTTTSAGEFLERDLGWAAWLLFESLAGHTERGARKFAEAWVKAPFFPHYSNIGTSNLLIGSSPRFDMYGNDFGWGKPIAVRTGPSNKFDGQITLHPSREGGGSVDLEVCISPESMTLLESDEEFMEVVERTNSIL